MKCILQEKKLAYLQTCLHVENSEFYLLLFVDGSRWGGDPGIGTFLFPGILKITWGIPEECVKNYAINNLDPHLQ